MKSIANYFILILLLISSLLKSQVTFIVSDLPENTPPEDIIYIAGTFNGWDPGDPDFALALNGEGSWEIMLGAQSEGSLIEFKFTRGDWGTVEKGANGEEIANRTFTYGNGDTVYVVILNWADVSGGTTATDNVSIIDDNFYMPQLDRYRRIWVYLPQNYFNNPDEHYPVLYMHDGQNVFDAFTSFAGEWEVDETLNGLEDQGVKVPIVVAIDNGGVLRTDEYSPWVNTNYGGGEGDAYVDFITETLKPYIDDNFRTLPDQIHTGIMGSSLGGLISYYGAINRQDIFGKAGLFSPSYWFSDTVWTFLQEIGSELDMRIYQMTGSLEGGVMVAQTLLMHDSLLSVGFTENELNTLIIQGGEHNELLWSSQFEDAYLWLFADYIGSDVETIELNETIDIYPNPAHNQLYIKNISNIDNMSIIILDITGKVVLTLNDNHGEPIDIAALKTGSYILHLQSESLNYYAKFIKN